MNKTLCRYVVIILCIVTCSVCYAKKYKPINEIPGQVPEAGKETDIWKTGRAHQQQIRQSSDVVKNPELEKYLEDIVIKLMGDMVQIIGQEIDVLVFKDPTVNAWVYPDGTIAVQTGLLNAMQNEAQLAAILGHEISHYLNRHAYIQLKAKQKQSAIGKGLGLLATAAVAAKTGTVDTGLINSGQIWTELVTSGYSRKLEKKADTQGLELMVAAGYPPAQALPAFETLRIKEDDQINISKMWSSHPDIDSRIKGLKKRIKKIKDAPEATPSETEYVKAVGAALLANSQLDVRDRKYDSALATLNRYISVFPKEPVGHYLQGELYRKQNPEGPDYTNRVQAYQAAINLNNNFAEAHKELGMAYRQQNQKEAAIKSLNAYLANKPKAADAPIIKWYVQDMQQNMSTNGGE